MPELAALSPSLLIRAGRQAGGQAECEPDLYLFTMAEAAQTQRASLLREGQTTRGKEQEYQAGGKASFPSY